MYKIVEQDPENCTCFGCMRLKQTKHLREKIQQLSESIGFIPDRFKIPDNKLSDSHAETTLEIAIASLSKIIENNEVFLRSTKGKVKFCADCGTAHRGTIGNSIILDNGKRRYLCTTCATQNYSRCADCGKLNENSSSRQVQSKQKLIKLCRDCFLHYKKCTFCNNHEKEMSTAVIKKYDDYEENFIEVVKPCCDQCRESVRSCDGCGCSGTNIEKYKNGNYCQNCIEVQRPLLEYSFKPVPVFKLGMNERKRKDTLFFGVEWEFENESDKSHEYYTKKFHGFFKDRLFYVKKDSTIRHGVEVVTYPFTWQRLKEDVASWTNVFALASTYLRANSSADGWHGSCGIHIHTSKGAYTTAQLYKKIKFTYDKRNRDFIMGISGREKENEYFRFRKQDEEHVPLIAKLKHLQSGERHSAINLQPRNTVEDRIFASTTHAPHFFKNLEFIHAVYYFSRDGSMKNLKWEDFINYIAPKPKTYANLHMYIKQNMNVKFAEYLTAKTGK